MFDFEKLEVYQHIKGLNSKVLKFIFDSRRMDDQIKENWKRVNINIALNLAEGTGRMQKSDKRHFITISRGSVFEAVAILDIVNGQGWINDELFKEFYDGYEKASKMLLGMIRSFSQPRNDGMKRQDDGDMHQNNLD